MTFELLRELIDVNNIPQDVILRSNSGWECSATEMNGVWYCESDNVIHFTQHGDKYDDEAEGDFKLIGSDK